MTSPSPTAPNGPIHVLCYGDAGAKKSTFAATFPTPALVCSFDPPGKDAPYLRRGAPGPLMTTDLGVPVREVLDPQGGLRFRIEHYIDADYERPQGFALFRRRLRQLDEERGWWETVIVDSLTYMQYAAQYESQYRVNRGVKDDGRGGLHYNYAKEAMQPIVALRLPTLPCNVVLTAHVDEAKDEVHGTMLYNPAAPGKLSKRLPPGYTELYRAYVAPTDPKRPDEMIYLLQTEKSAQFNAASQIPAPNPCVPDYAALWKRSEGRAG